MARGQGCNVTDDEIERVVDFIKRQGNPVFNPRFLDLEPPKPQQAEEIQSTGTPEGDLVNEIIAYMSMGNHVSTTKIQTKFNIGYPRAARIIERLSLNNPAAAVISVAEALSGITVSLLVLFVSSFTVFSRRIMYFLCLWRGASLGCAAALLVSGVISGLPANASCALMTAFLQTVVFVLLVSFSDVYSDCFLQIFSQNDRLYKNAFVREFLLCYLTLSGIILSAGIIEVLILIN